MSSNGMRVPSVEEAGAQLKAAEAQLKAAEALEGLRAKVDGAVRGASKEMSKNPTTGVLTKGGVEFITARITERVEVTVEKGTGIITTCIKGKDKAITDEDIAGLARAGVKGVKGAGKAFDRFFWTSSFVIALLSYCLFMLMRNS